MAITLSLHTSVPAAHLRWICAAFLLFSTSSSVGCDEHFFGVYRIALSGGISAPAVLSLSKGDGLGQVSSELAIMTASFTQNDDSKSSPLMTFKMMGTCRNQVIEYRLPANSGDNSAFKVLGGSMLAVMDARVFPMPVGVWEVMLFDLETRKNFKLSGSWQQETIINGGDLHAR